ncbi:hypothetical protein M8C21_033937 [Ambrosia artemisiifolia]|uniref:Uncharacterized protein n=1 Tax=Ambrosia artemisiifolia TaxID=4212 RepID=A0AAD5C1F4_AMBAR|nr:hypothetical protein M8C21_033937 [Ambrosia artemisiifolia]
MNTHPTSHFKLPLFTPSLSPSLPPSFPASPPPSPKVLLILPQDLIMNRFAFANKQPNNNNALVTVGDTMNGVVCPKPRRFHHNIHPIESKPRMDLLDMILTKECYDGERATNFLPSSPPFFSGSPPNRASNPLAQDAMFGKEDPNPFSHAFEASPSSSARGSCGRGQKHPAVRVEGFNSRGISAVA